ncbi:MAG: DMT family transporter [Acetobacteraceae bacterium]|nr:DMT family transporter [Acetobacteraceae bacterium]MDW8398062.1 DMT family transporter [Acetobacteraceae bacterium]
MSVAADVAPRDLRLLLLAVVLFGVTWPISKDALRDASPLWFAFARGAGGALVTGLLMLWLGRLRPPGAAEWPTVLALALFQLGGFFALTHLALALVPAGRTAVLSNVTAIWLIPLGVWLFAERLSAARLASVAAGLAGVVLLTGPWAVDWSDRGAVLGHALLLGAGLSWSVAIVIVRRFPPRRPVFELLPFSFGLGALLLGALAAWREPSGGIGAGALWQALFVALVAAPVGTWAVVEAGRRLPSAVASAGFLLVPAIGVTLAALWLGEAITWDLVAGGVLIALGMWWAARR